MGFLQGPEQDQAHPVVQDRHAGGGGRPAAEPEHRGPDWARWPQASGETSGDHRQPDREPHEVGGRVNGERPLEVQGRNPGEKADGRNPIEVVDHLDGREAREAPFRLEHRQDEPPERGPEGGDQGIPDGRGVFRPLEQSADHRLREKKPDDEDERGADALEDEDGRVDLGHEPVPSLTGELGRALHQAGLDAVSRAFHHDRRDRHGHGEDAEVGGPQDVGHHDRSRKGQDRA